MEYIIQFSESGRWLIDVPTTGFKSTTNPDKATRFGSQDEAKGYLKARGIFGPARILPYYRMPVLTELEKFVLANASRPPAALATELNRTEQAIWAAFTRADGKAKDIAAIKEIYGNTKD